MYVKRQGDGCVELIMPFSFMGQLTIARFRGDTTFGLVARIMSTFFGSILGMLMWYAVSPRYSFKHIMAYLEAGTYLAATGMEIHTASLPSPLFSSHPYSIRASTGQFRL